MNEDYNPHVLFGIMCAAITTIGFGNMWTAFMFALAAFFYRSYRTAQAGELVSVPVYVATFAIMLAWRLGLKPHFSIWITVVGTMVLITTLAGHVRRTP